MRNGTKRHSGTIAWLLALGVAALVGLALGPALAGTASAAPLEGAAASPATQWAYGGQGFSNGTTTFGAATLSWNATFGWTVIDTATNTSNATAELEEQRTVGVSLTATLTAPNASATYQYHGTESDLAFVNLTDAATVYVRGAPVAALGIDNESLSVRAAVDQSLVESVNGNGHSAFLNVSGEAQSEVQFAPALGLLPLDLNGTTHWNSSAVASPSANWSITYAWADLGWNGTVGSGNGTFAGNWTASAPVSLEGAVVVDPHLFSDHRPRVAVAIQVFGPVDAYDGFVLVPHGFDLFGGASHGYDRDAIGSASVGYGAGQTLFVSPGARGPMVTAAATNFGASDSTVGAVDQPLGGPSPAASSTGPSAEVYGQPMSVAQAQAENACLTGTCAASPSSGPTDAVFAAALVGLAVVVIVGSVSVIEWRAYARRRAQRDLDGRYAESGPNRRPPTGALQGPTAEVPPPGGPPPPRS